MHSMIMSNNDPRTEYFLKHLEERGAFSGSFTKFQALELAEVAGVVPAYVLIATHLLGDSLAEVDEKVRGETFRPTAKTYMKRGIALLKAEAIHAEISVN